MRFSNLELSDFEAHAVASIRESGGVFKSGTDDLPRSDDGDRRIRAEVIKRLLTRKTLHDGDVVAELDCLSIEGVVIVGLLDLSDVNISINGLTPAVTFKNCCFVPSAESLEALSAIEPDPDREPEHVCGIDLTNGRFGRFSLEGSRFVWVKARSAWFAGSFDLTGVASSEVPGEDCTGCPPQFGLQANGNNASDTDQLGRCEVDLRGARVQGDVRGGRASLCARIKLTEKLLSEGNPWALDLSNTVIDGEVWLRPSFVAEGGVTFAEARVGNSVWLGAATVSAHWHDEAINFQHARISGSVAIRAILVDDTEGGGKLLKPFESRGVIRMYGTDIDGEVYCSGAHFRAKKFDAQKPFDKDSQCLQIAYARINKVIRGRPANEIVPNQGEQLRRFICEGSVNLHESQIGGLELDWSNALGDELEPAIYTNGVTFRGDVNVFSTQTPRPKLRQLTITQCHIGGSLLISGLAFGGHLNALAVDLTETRVANDLQIGLIQGSGGGPVKSNGLDARQISVGRNLQISHVTSSQAIWLRDSAVDGNVRISDLTLNSPPSILNLVGMRVQRNLSVTNVETYRDIAAEGLRVDGNVTWASIKFIRASSERNQTFDLSGASIAGQLEFEKISSGGIIRDATQIKRVTKLSFYKDPRTAKSLKLYEAETPQGAVAFIWDGGQSQDPSRPSIIILDGTSPPIHAINARGRNSGASPQITSLLTGTRSVLRLSKKNADAYLRFFCAYVWGEEGAFRIVTDETELNNEILEQAKEKAIIDSDLRKELDRRLRLEVRPQNKNFLIDAIVSYGGALFAADFRVLPNGMCEMLNDQPLAVGFPRALAYEQPFRRSRLDAAIAKDDFKWPEHASIGISDWEPEGPYRAQIRIGELVERGEPFSSVVAGQVIGSRTCSLSFYDGWRCVQALFRDDDFFRVISWLEHPAHTPQLLTGDSQPIHAVNEIGGGKYLKLDTKRRREDYLRFFCRHVWGEKGAFLIVEVPKDLPTLSTDKALEEYLEPLKDVTLEATTEGAKLYRATVAYAGHLFRADFKIEVPSEITHKNAGSIIEMISDDQIPDVEFSSNIGYVKPSILLPKALGNVRDATRHPFQADWKNLSGGQQKEVMRALRENKRPLELTLREVDVRTLRDSNGSGVADDVTLNLSAFRFDQIDLGASEARSEQIETSENPFSTRSSEFNKSKTSQSERQVEPARRAKDRLKWLERYQYRDEKSGSVRDAANSNEFDAHPYEQVIRAYNVAGYTEDANKVLYEKLDRQYRFYTARPRDTSEMSWFNVVTWKFPVWMTIASTLLGMLLYSATQNVGLSIAWGSISLVVALYGLTALRWFYKVGFGYGLSLPRAIATILLLIIGVGWPATEMANRGQLKTMQLFGVVPAVELVSFRDMPQVLVVDQRPVHAYSDRSSTFMADDAPREPKEIPCGLNINEFVYAADVFLPLVDLGHEVECRPTDQAWAVAWRWGKAFYTLLGWIILSLAILTASGVIRRAVER